MEVVGHCIKGGLFLAFRVTSQKVDVFGTVSVTLIPLTATTTLWHNSNMQIDIPDDQFKKLSERAQAAGFADVPAFISAIAGEPFDDPRSSMTEEELRQSVAELEAADATIDAGGGHDAREALLKLGRGFGFKRPE